MQSKFRRQYRRRTEPKLLDSDVILLQDVKDLALFLLASPISVDLVGYLHLEVTDRFLRALIIYMQNYLVTWTELGDRRAATAKKLPNPLAGGARLERAEEMRALRCCLAREYVDMLMACRDEAKRFHHAGAGRVQYAQSNGEKDLRVFEGLLQIAHAIVWLALERRHAELIGNEIIYKFIIFFRFYKYLPTE